MPIHVLEQQLPKEDTMKLDDAVIEGQEIDYSRFYDEKGNEYSSVSELVQTRLGLDDDDAIQEYNKENPSLPYIPYEKLRTWIRRIFRKCCRPSLMKPTMWMHTRK